MTPRIDINEVSQQLRATETLTDVIDVVRTGARRLVDSDGATVVLREGDLCFYADEDSIAPLWKGQRFPIGDCVSGWAMLHHATAVVPDIWSDPRVPQAAYRPTYVNSLVMVPIDRERPAGAIGTYWARPHAATAREVATLEHLAAAAADALRRIGLAGAPWAPNFAVAEPASEATAT